MPPLPIHPLPQLARWAWLGLGILLLVGCAPLTASQVRAVHSYAEAVRGYPTLAGGVLRSYAELREGAGVLGATAAPLEREAAGAAFDKLYNGARQREALDAQAQELDQALGVLDTYSELLGKLSSDDFTEALAKSAGELSESTDSAIAAYNGQFQAKLPQFGPGLAAGVRAAGGWFLRAQQARWLHTYVEQGSPIVEALATRVEALLDDYLPRSEAPNLLDNEVERLKSVQKLMASSTPQLDLGRADRLSALLDRVLLTKRLATAAKKSTAALREAHRALREALNEKRDLAGRIEQVTAVAAEVKAGIALKKQLDEKKP